MITLIGYKWEQLLSQSDSFFKTEANLYSDQFGWPVRDWIRIGIYPWQESKYLFLQETEKWDPDRTERNVCFHLCIFLWLLALRKRHEKTNSACIRMTFVLTIVPVSHRLRIICLISFLNTAANWTMLCVNFSRLAVQYRRLLVACS